MTLNASTDVDRDTGAASLTERIVEATTDVTGADPLDLPPLYDAVDPDALEVLCDCDDADGPLVEFAYAGCGITVRGDGSVRVTPEPIDARESTVVDGTSLSPDC
mgnify:CR=1 FL=1